MAKSKSKEAQRQIGERDKLEQKRLREGKNLTTGRKLTNRQDQFAKKVAEVKAGTAPARSNSQIARESGYSEPSAVVAASQNIRKANVAEAIEVYQIEQSDKARGLVAEVSRLGKRVAKSLATVNLEGVTDPLQATELAARCLKLEELSHDLATKTGATAAGEADLLLVEAYKRKYMRAGATYCQRHSQDDVQAALQRWETEEKQLLADVQRLTRGYETSVQSRSRKRG